MMPAVARKLAPVLAVLLLATFAPSAGAADPDFRALSGTRASSFSVPGDMRIVERFPLLGLRYERYQQVFGSREAEVLGGQITVYRRSSGEANTVIGAHYGDIQPSNKVALSGAEARAVAARDVGKGRRRVTTLMISPNSGRYFYSVETLGFATHWIHWVDAGSGKVTRRFDAIKKDHGTGVKGDTKDINGPDNANTADDLTAFHSATGHGASGPHWDLTSKDNRQTTYDARNKANFLYYVFDLDNHWLTSGRTSPGQPALVDAQYYANLTDDYFRGRFGLNWTSTCGYSAMQSVGHYKRNYSNAFWDGTYVVYGDGDGQSDREYSGGLDVVAHEHTHGVTQCTSGLGGSGEPDALNESFSDMLGNSAEFFANEPTSSNCTRASGQSACADWWVGEDVDRVSDTVPGFRNMADPREDGDPDHYSELVTAGDEHANAGISNHAYYLLVNGGKNAGCDSAGSNGHTHTLDCNVTVTGIGLADAERIFFQGFTSLATNATMCQARQATDAAAISLFGANSQQRTSTDRAWDAVGLHSSCGGGASYSQTILGTPGLVSYWRLGETSGTSATDATGANSGTYAGGASLGQPGAIVGDSNTAVGFDGVNDEMSAAGPALSTAGSLEGWFYWTGGGALMRDNTGSGGWILAYDSSGLLYYRLGGTSLNSGRTTASVRNGWHHFVATKNGGSADLYIDGQLVHSATTAGTTASAMPWHVMHNGILNQYSAGRADEVAVYNTALSATTIS